MASEKMTFLARMKVKPEKEAEFIALAQRFTAETRANEPGCLAYEFFRLREEPNGFAVFESFANAEAEQAHRDSAHFAELAPPLLECLDGTYVREYLDHLD